MPIEREPFTSTTSPGRNSGRSSSEAALGSARCAIEGAGEASCVCSRAACAAAVISLPHAISAVTLACAATSAPIAACSDFDSSPSSSMSPSTSTARPPRTRASSTAAMIEARIEAGLAL
jgi:hypothetical protein